jgi:hypothetical protein
MLERAGLLGWQNRIKRVREDIEDRDLFGKRVWRWRVIRTSNSYTLNDPGASKCNLATETTNQVILTNITAPLDPSNPLQRALLQLDQAIGGSARAGH